MRSNKINPLFTEMTSIPGIGPKLGKLFNKLAGPNIINLLWHLPYNVIKRKKHDNILNAKINSIITCKINIINHVPSKFKKQPYKVNCLCNNIPIVLVFFFAKHPYIKSTLPIGEERFISGKLEYYKNNYQITHPSHIIKTNDINKFREIEPIYSLTKGLTQKNLLKSIDFTLSKLPQLDEWIDTKTINKYSFKNWNQSLKSIHNPKSSDDLISSNINRRRLAYDELLAHQLAIEIIRNFNQKQKGIRFIKNSLLPDKLISNLPFELTKSQLNAWEEIKKDLISPNQMVRLLQGDVGCGKTIVSILAMLHAIESGFQTAMMVPTSILAQQHFVNIGNLLKDFKIKIIILTGKDKGKIRLQKIQSIKNGEAQIIIGTHSLIQEDVTYQSIGLVVIDEQHKFGVFQRMAFSNKGKKPSILVMSATPIPRTLSLAAYGDMDESKIIEKPLGRMPIITKAHSINKIEEIINRLKIKLSNNEKAYWVCPLIEQSEELDIKAAEDRFLSLENEFKGEVLLIHGQLKDSEKEEIMNKFKNEKYKILVATTVIEVGIDIKNATTLVIEHAERFGLAQLHQLRGRVGRNSNQSTCLLLYKEQLGESAKERIKKMKETNDGFKIAEKDLEIRGAGEILGKKQSGIPSFLIADLTYDKDLLEDVRKFVFSISKNDPRLQSENGKNLKQLLYLFEREVAIKTLQSG